jgi:putative CocE/NonD family hydrolase
MPVARRPLAVLASGLLAGAALTAVVAAPHRAGAVTDPVQDAIAASAAPGPAWTARPATYTVAEQTDVPVRMADGTVLRADIATPADPATGQPAKGPFPVLLTQTPYGKDSAGAIGSAAIGIDPYFVRRGYIDVAVDVRGTGDSGGRFDLFDPQQVRDGVALVEWAARLPRADGRVGLHGASYLGIDQMLTAAAVGPNSPLKAIFPIVSANDVYRDTAFMGGIPDAEFDLVYLGGLLPAVNLANPVAAALQHPAELPARLDVLGQHARNTLDYNAAFLLQTYLGGPESYDSRYWHDRSPGYVLDRIVANGIPAYLVGGEYDLFQRGEPLNYAGLQNAWAGRPVGRPMPAGAATTGRYQLLMGPYTHLAVGVGGNALDELMLRWYDTWLRGLDTGMARTRTPLHVYDLGTGHYRNTTTYPLTGTSPTTYWFGPGRSGTALSSNDGALTATRPPSAAAADRVLWAPVGTSVCDRSLDQWLMGAFTIATDSLPTPAPCFADDRPAQTGPTALTYTTAPLTRPRTIAGPIAATLYATASTTDTEWVVNVEDVAPDGTSEPLTQGALLGSFRTVDGSRSWTVGGRTVLPYHPYTEASARPVRPGAVTRYDIEVFPTFATVAAGHRIRVTVQTTDAPHLAPTPPQMTRLLGGVYEVQRRAGAASSITLPLLG